MEKSQEIFKKFKDKKILIMGLGLHGGGVGAAKFFAKAGAKVVATDLRTKKQLRESIRKLKGLPIKYVLGKHREEDFKNADLIIRNPAVPDESPYLKIARKHKVPIDTDIGIFFELLTAPKSFSPGSDPVDSTGSDPGEQNHPIIIGITGTRGKSTTSALIYKFLKTKYPNTILAGNIRKSVLSELPKIFRICHPEAKPKDLINKECTACMRFFTPLRLVQNDNYRSFIVLELSSWQIEGLAKHKKSPHIAVITTIQPDHLNRYKEMKEYIEAKKGIFKFQKNNDFLFLNQNDEIIKNFANEAKSRTLFFRAREANKYQTNLLGTHNLSNIAAAVKVARHFEVGENAIKKVLKNFKGLEGRIQPIAIIKGVKYINDTTATTPDAAIAAINAITNQYPLFSNHLILIAGGADKNLDFKNLAKLITRKVKKLILLKGAATEKIKKELAASGLPPAASVEVNSMHKAVEIAYNVTKRGDIILLSPACASFGMFRHEFERGEKFNRAVSRLKK